MIPAIGNQYLNHIALDLFLRTKDTFAPFQPQTGLQIASRCSHCRCSYPEDDKKHRYLYSNDRVFGTHWFSPICIENFRYDEDGKFYCPVKHCDFSHADHFEMDRHYKGPIHAYGASLTGFECFKPMRRSGIFDTWEYMPDYTPKRCTPEVLETENELELGAFIDRFTSAFSGSRPIDGTDGAEKLELRRLAETEMHRAFEAILKHPERHPDAGESVLRFIRDAYKTAVGFMDDIETS
ncbi:hypothetical protein BJ508DRAFT_313343 [Ascobolus immersus RN42]|uniref:Uncharacterized protein n=1 Tax=Ascobolus immersus RN42 TaxID=1160509 RepID=A0A3N4HW56_ASCIM|nr:hypothetical protein BJ508DRAFT_313343 [Ascobolus immersus RN42]